MSSHDTQNQDYENVSAGGVHSHNTGVDFDQGISRHRSKLTVLYHAATCPCDKLTSCPSGVVHCCASKRLFAHIITCTSGKDCDVPGCQHSKRVWGHYRKCRHNIERRAHRSMGPSATKTCDICSAVPVCHDALVLCDRFQTETSLCPHATISTNHDPRNTKIQKNAAAEVEHHRFSGGRIMQSQGSENQCHRLPVWRKRNLLHAQQMQQHVQLLRNEKENTTGPIKFATSGKEKRQLGRVSYIRGALHDSNDSLNRPGSQNLAGEGKNSYEIKRTNRSFSSTTQNKLDISDMMTGDSSYGSSPGFLVPIQLPVHPRDAKRKSKSAVQSINRLPS